MTDTTKWYEGNLTIDGVTVAVTISKSEPYSADEFTLQDVIIEIPALELWFADIVMRAISEEYKNG